MLVRSNCCSMTLNTFRARRRTGGDGESRVSASRSDAELTNGIALVMTRDGYFLAEAVDEGLRRRDRKEIGGPCGGPGQCVRDAVHVHRHRIHVLMGRTERKYAEVHFAGDFGIERRAVAAAVNDQPSVGRVLARAQDVRQQLGISAVEHVVGPPLVAYFAIGIGQHIGGGLIAEDSAEACQVRSRGLADASFAAAEEYEFGPAHKTLRSRASIMICWAETTLPSSTVRSEALITNLLSSALLGRSVMGTVSGSPVWSFWPSRALALAQQPAPRLGAFAAGAEDTSVGAGFAASTGARTGAGAELLPAGWLAAAAMRAASSLESRFFFMERPFWVMVRWCGITIPRLRNIATPRSHECAASRHFAAGALQ